MLLSEVHQVSISYVFWLVICCFYLIPCWEAAYREHIHWLFPLICRLKEKAYILTCVWVNLKHDIDYIHSLRVYRLFSAPGELPPLIVYITWLLLTDWRHPTRFGEKTKNDFPFEKEHYRKSVVWLHYLKGRRRFPLYVYATCLPLGKTAFFFAIKQPLKTF